MKDWAETENRFAFIPSQNKNKARVYYALAYFVYKGVYMIQVTPLCDETKGAFEKLFAKYYAELDCDDDTKHLVDEYILPDLLSGLICIDLLKDGDVFSGFVVYQIDDIDNEWNFKEGFGDVREIYVAPSSRGKGYGKFLLYTAEMKLKEAGAKKAYCLPFEDAAGFFEACGYKITEEYCEELDCPVYEKADLDNRCGG